MPVRSDLKGKLNDSRGLFGKQGMRTRELFGLSQWHLPSTVIVRPWGYIREQGLNTQIFVCENELSWTVEQNIESFLLFDSPISRFPH